MTLVRVRLDSGAEATVGASFAESHGLEVLDKPATTRLGKALPAKYPVDLAGSPTKKRRRPADTEAGGTPVTGDTPGGESATSEEDSQ
jgi:hypothetical protein